MLAVFPEDTEVPLAVVGQLWGREDEKLDEMETEELVMKLALEWKVVEMTSWDPERVSRRRSR